MVEILPEGLLEEIESWVGSLHQEEGRACRQGGLEADVHSVALVGKAFLCRREVEIVDRLRLGCPLQRVVEAGLGTSDQTAVV